MSDILCRPIDSNDLDDLRKLRNLLRKHFINTNFVNEDEQIVWWNSYKINNNDQLYCFYDKRLTVVGYGGFSNYSVKYKTIEVGRFMVHPSHQRKGFLGEIINQLQYLAKLKHSDLKSMHLIVSLENKNAIKAYKKYGFLEIEKNEKNFIR